jgi:hypothetical protein
MIIQYLGYESKLNARSYSFRVVDVLMKEREFKVNIKNQSLLDNHFKCQDVPDLCFSKLKHDLTSETQEHALPLRMTVSDAEFQKYIEVHYPSKRSLIKPR